MTWMVSLYLCVDIPSPPISLIILIRVPQTGLLSATLTGFALDSKEDLKPSPADETVYYLRQHSTILSQISVHSAFSLVATLLAILVQQWVCNSMHVFHRNGDPLKSARLGQYLYEGCEGWHMPMVA